MCFKLCTDNVFFSLLILTAWCLLMGTRLLPSPGRTNRCITVVLLATSLVPAPIAWCVEMVWLPRAAQGKVVSWLDEISSRVQLLHDTDMFLRCWNPVMLQGSFWFNQAALRGVFDFAPANATCLQEESIRGVWWKFTVLSSFMRGLNPIIYLKIDEYFSISCLCMDTSTV